jgi:hypothetical protein
MLLATIALEPGGAQLAVMRRGSARNVRPHSERSWIDVHIDASSCAPHLWLFSQVSASASTNAALKLSPGTLDGSIRRMLDLDLILELNDRERPKEDDQRRRYYRITAFGRSVAQADATRLSAETAARSFPHKDRYGGFSVECWSDHGV